MNARLDFGARPRAAGLNDIATHLSLAERLLREGRAADAEHLARQALFLQPRSAESTMLIARAQMHRNSAAEACDTLQAFIESTVRVPGDLLLLRARALLAAEHIDNAIPAFHEAVAAMPHSGEAELGLAVAFGRTGRYEAAVIAARNAIAKGADSAGARFVLGRALSDCNRFDEAEAEFRRVLQFQSMHVAAITALADLVWMRSGDVQAAVVEIDAALRTMPRLAALRVAKARLLDAAGDSERGYREVTDGLALTRDAVELHLAAAQISMKLDAKRALEHAEHALRLAPNNTDALGLCADALLATGRPEEVAALAEELLQIDPDDGHAIAVRASAWRQLGDPRYRALYDYASVVRAAPLDTPPGWTDLPSYLDDLARSLHRRHSLHAHPVSQSLRHGTQVSIQPQSASEPAIRAFTQAIAGPVRRYLDALGAGDDLLRRRNTGAVKLGDMWSVRLRSSGHHVNHFHGKGWLSSACYIELPPELETRGGEGWLKFGEPGIPMQPPQPPEYLVRPEPGLLVLFPSWMWHGSVPFASPSGRTRLSIAFDLLPF